MPVGMSFIVAKEAIPGRELDRRLHCASQAGEGLRSEGALTTSQLVGPVPRARLHKDRTVRAIGLLTHAVLEWSERSVRGPANAPQNLSPTFGAPVPAIPISPFSRAF
jgi:hypothetical protein